MVRRALPWLLVTPLLAACGGGGGPAASAAEGASTQEPEDALADPRIADVVRLLEAGLPEAAWTVLDQLEGGIGVVGPCLRARAALAGGDAVGALREVEDARALAPDDPRVLGLEVEVLAALDRTESARDALRAAWKRVGRTAELERARGVLLLRTPGAGREALEALEAARSLDPGLPFLAFPLAQAHLLAGRLALGAERPEEALEHARAVRARDREDPGGRELEAEALADLHRYEEALELYDGLAREGRELGATRALLHQRRGTLLLLAGERAAAAEAYVRARELGLDEEGLGFGATVLAEVALERVEEGLVAYEAGRLEEARAAFEAALRCDPASLEARNHLAVCRFQLEDPRGAAEAWAEVWERARRDGVELPDPVHLNLARAWRLAGEEGRAREVLAAYLDREPEGRWSEETRALLEALEAEALLGGGR